MNTLPNDGSQNPLDREAIARSNAYRRRMLKTGLGVGSLLAVGAGLTAWAVSTVAGSDGPLSEGVNTQERLVTICDKEALNDQMLVSYADENGDRHVAEVKPSIFVGGYRQTPEEFYFDLDIDATYQMTISGFRVGELGLFNNIVEVERLNPQPETNLCER